MNLRRLAVIAIIPMVMILVACSPYRASNPFITNQVWVIAHQGGEGIFPSNTIYAFERAVNMGADMLDLDVHSSKDGQLVVIHDDSVDRTTNAKGKVHDLTLEQLQTLDAGWYWPQFSKESDAHPFRGQGIRIPKLEEVFKAFPNVPYTIEIKQEVPSIAVPFCAMLRTYKLEKRVIIASFRETAMREFRAACPEVMTSMVESEVRPIVYYGLAGLIELASPASIALQVPVKAGGFEVVTPGLVAWANRRGVVVQPWTINEPDEMRRLIAMGVHGINTDRPDLLLEVLGRK
jgi:glycerophosphoryl diester phosphodiesterase